MEWIGFKKIEPIGTEFSRKIFQKNLIEIRKKEKLTQQKMADKLGIKRSTIGAMEEGRAMSLEIIFKISKLFKISIDDLVTKLI